MWVVFQEGLTLTLKGGKTFFILIVGVLKNFFSKGQRADLKKKKIRLSRG